MAKTPSPKTSPKTPPKTSPKTPKKTAGARAGGPSRPTLSFSRANAIWLGAAAAAIVVGYALLAGGSMTLAPILLVIGYCVLLPIGIIKR